MPGICPLSVSVWWRTAAASRARRAGPIRPCRLGAHQRADPCPAPGIGESSGTRVIHVPYVVEQDEDGVWCASAQLRRGRGGRRRSDAEAAVDDPRDALEASLAEAGCSLHDRHRPA